MEQVQPVNEKKFFLKPLSIGLIISLVLVSGVSGFFFGAQYAGSSNRLAVLSPSPVLIPSPTIPVAMPSTTSIPSTAPTITAKPDEYAGWLTYTNSKYGYKLRYPSTFSVFEKDPVVCPTLDPQSPPMLGCTPINDKGDHVIVYNKSRDARADFNKYSELLIRVSSDPPVKNSGCISINKPPPYKRIVINGNNFYEVTDTNGKFSYLINSYEKSEDTHVPGNYRYCETAGMTNGSFTIYLNTNMGGFAQEDQGTIMQIIKSITY